MNHPFDLAGHKAQFHDEDSNRSDNAHFDAVLQARLSRRGLLRGAVGTASAAVFGSVVEQLTHRNESHVGTSSGKGVGQLLNSKPPRLSGAKR